MIPVSKDGSKFDRHTCFRAGGYIVGAKGRERKIPLYEDALAALKTMPKPRFRRPNIKGNWGLVTGITWTASI
jgi:hypothetical protein